MPPHWRIPQRVSHRRLKRRAYFWHLEHLEHLAEHHDHLGVPKAVQQHSLTTDLFNLDNQNLIAIFLKITNIACRDLDEMTLVVLG